MLNKEKQAQLLHDAAVMTGLDAHVKTTALSTAAEKIMQLFGGSKNTPRKTSFLFCDSVDACFYYNSFDSACVTFTARWYAGAKDLEGDRPNETAKIIRTMLNNMQALVDKEIGGAN